MALPIGAYGFVRRIMPGRGLDCRVRRAGRLPAFSAILACALAAGCAESPQAPEAALKEMLTRAEAFAEAGEAGALADLVADDYEDAGGRDRAQLALMLRGLLMRYPRLELVVSVERIELFSPVLAQVELRVLAAGAGAGRVSAEGLRISASLRDDGEGWRVTSARWDGRRGI
jgi:hypothetical protein